MTLESELETIRTNIVTNLTSKGVTASNTESLNDLVGKVNTVKTPITSSLVLKETYQNDISGVVDCLRDKFRINLSKQGVETLSTDGLTTLSNSISLIKQDTVLTLTSNKTSASTGETVTLTATLVDINGNPVNGATVVFMEGNTTLYSGITDSAGKSVYSYSKSVNGTFNLNCAFNTITGYNSSVSNTIVISIIDSIIDYVVFPAGYASNTGTISANDDVYDLSLNQMGMIGVYNAKYPLLNTQSYTITCQIKNSNIYNAQCGLGVVSKTNTAYSTYEYLQSINSKCLIRIVKNYSASNLNETTLSSGYRSTWLNYKIVLNGTSFTYTITDTNNSTIYSGSITLDSTLNTTLYPAIFAGWDACTVQFKNFKVVKA